MAAPPGARAAKVKSRSAARLNSGATEAVTAPARRTSPPVSGPLPARTGPSQAWVSAARSRLAPAKPWMRASEAPLVTAMWPARISMAPPRPATTSAKVLPAAPPSSAMRGADSETRACESERPILTHWPERASPPESVIASRARMSTAPNSDQTWMLLPEASLTRARRTEPPWASISSAPVAVRTRRFWAASPRRSTPPRRAIRRTSPAPVASMSRSTRISGALTGSSPVVSSRMSAAPVERITSSTSMSSAARPMKSPSRVWMRFLMVRSRSASRVSAPSPFQVSGLDTRISPRSPPDGCSVVIVTSAPPFSVAAIAVARIRNGPDPGGGAVSPGGTLARPALVISTSRGSSSHCPPRPSDTSASGPMASRSAPEVSTKPPPPAPVAASAPSTRVESSAQAMIVPPAPVPPLAETRAPASMLR